MATTTVTAIDDSIVLYQTRDLNSPVIADVLSGGKIDLGGTRER